MSSIKIVYNKLNFNIKIKEDKNIKFFLFAGIKEKCLFHECNTNQLVYLVNNTALINIPQGLLLKLKQLLFIKVHLPENIYQIILKEKESFCFIIIKNIFILQKNISFIKLFN